MIKINIPSKWTKQLLDTYLKAHDFPRPGFKYPNAETYIYIHGIFYIPQFLPPKYKLGQLGECFNNVLNIVRHNSNLCYVEGIAVYDNTIPHIHAWCVEKDSLLVIDPTWIIDNAIYKGIQFDIEFAIEQIELRGSILGINDSTNIPDLVESKLIK